MKVKSESKVAQSCLTLSDPMDCSPPGSSIHGIFQARVLEWGAIAFSRIYIYKYIYIYLFILGCAESLLLRRLFSSSGKRGLLLPAWASHCGGFSCCRAQALGLSGFSSCSVGTQSSWLPGSRVQVQWLWCTGLAALCGMWDLPRPGIEPESPA